MRRASHTWSLALRAATVCWVGCALAAAAPAQAGGRTDLPDLGDTTPAADGGGAVLAAVVPMRVDSRCMPLRFALNAAADPIPNPLGDDFLALADARRAIEAAMRTWNAVPTSFIEMRIEGTTQNSEPLGLDFRNEIRFVSDPDAARSAIASTSPVTLQRAADLTAGADLDGDGDADVAAGIESCADVDGDGDIEFPPGRYPAGTILDVDIQLNTSRFRFTTAPGDADDNPLSLDLQAIMVHELGHAHGLAHSQLDQLSDRDGRSSTMFFSFDSDDPQDQLLARDLDMDSVLASTSAYPEGSAASGPAALQAGDQDPQNVFGTVSGSVRAPDNTPIAGASVFCRNAAGAIVSSAYTGRTRARFTQQGQTLQLAMPAADSVVDGDFRMSLPPGNYECGVEAVDGAPQLIQNPGSVNFTVQIGDQLGQQNFPEEFFDGAREAPAEITPGAADPVRVQRGATVSGIDLIANADIALNGFVDTRVAAFANAPPGSSFAIVVPGAALLDLERQVQEQVAADATLALHTALFQVRPDNRSQVPQLTRVSVTRCTNPEEATAPLVLDPDQPLREMRSVAAQDSDFTPIYLDDSVELGRTALDGLRSGTFRDLCLVLETPAGANSAPLLLGIDDPMANGAGGLSFFSASPGAPFMRINQNLHFSLGVIPVRP